jgi:hypothetical protein
MTYTSPARGKPRKAAISGAKTPGRRVNSPVKVASHGHRKRVESEQSARVTTTEFAAIVGFTEEAIKSAIRRQRITAVDADGLLDLDLARHQWETNRKRDPGPGRPRQIDIERAEKAELDEAALRLADILLGPSELAEQDWELLNILGGGVGSFLAWADIAAARLAELLEYADADRLRSTLLQEMRRWCALLVTPEHIKRR